MMSRKLSHLHQRLNVSSYLVQLESSNALPQGLVLNPATLARSNRSKKKWISCRVRLLVDLDPIRNYGNASDDEKAAAYSRRLRSAIICSRSVGRSLHFATVAMAITCSLPLICPMTKRVRI